MFEIGHDQAAGLRAAPLPPPAVRVMPVSCLSQPAQAYELLCSLAAHLTALQETVVIVDGSAAETRDRHLHNSAHLGLLHALQDPAVAGLEHAPYGSEWLVMPGALGLQALAQTAQLAGPEVALSRLAAPFAPGVCVLVFAPAQLLAAVFGGLDARAMVPVLGQTQTTLDAYSALKQLHLGGVAPVLAPLPDRMGQGSVPLQQAVETVVGCAQRHLGLAPDVWPQMNWGPRAQACALTPAASRAAQVRRAATPSPELWS
jgi:hypothetical protein